LNRPGAIYTMIAFMVVFWAMNFTVAKFALREFPPALLTGARLTLAAAMIAPIYLWSRRRQTEEPWTRRDVPFLVILGLFGVALNQLFFMLGLSRTSVAHSSIIIATGPIMILLIAAILGVERLGARKAAGMAVALGGVALLKIFETHPLRGQGPTWTGDLLTLCGTFCFSLFTVYAKRASTTHSAITVNTFGYLGGALAMAPVTLWQSAGFSFSRISPAAWASLFYMALFPSVVCYLIYYHALTHIATSRVAAFSYIQPVLATGMGVWLLGEHVTPALMLSGAVVFAGVYLTERG